MLIKRKNYEALLSEKQKLRNVRDNHVAEIEMLVAVIKKKDNAISAKDDTITFLKAGVAGLEERITDLSNRLHKKDQPRTSGGRFGKK